jgi:hypothetical protein
MASCVKANRQTATDTGTYTATFVQFVNTVPGHVLSLPFLETAKICPWSISVRRIEIVTAFFGGEEQSTGVAFQ